MILAAGIMAPPDLL